MSNPLEPPEWYDVYITVKGETIHMIMEADSLASLLRMLRLLLGDRYNPQDVIIRRKGY
jgi:hypothetical protein